jgi:hypothetical protein
MATEEPAPAATVVAPAGSQRFTTQRLALCADAETALAKAQEAVGHLIPAREARHWWSREKSDREQAPAADRWNWMLAPAIAAGRVVKVLQHRNVLFFGVAGAPASSRLPTGRRYGTRLLSLSQRGEEALKCALEQNGAMVSAEEIGTAWRKQFGGGVPASTAFEWKRVLRPAIAAGSVAVTRRGNTLYFGLKQRPEYTLPPLPLPKFHPGRVEMSDRAVRAIEAAVATSGFMASTDEVCAAWEALYGEPAPRVLRQRMLRVLEPAWARGRIRVANRLTNVLQFAPAERAELVPRDYISDLERTGEALLRAMKRTRSAVLLEEIETEIANDPALTLQSCAATLANHLCILVDCGRAILVRSAHRRVHCRSYYSLPWGPRWVLSVAEHHLDRRLAAARALWRASRGRTFTTTALRKFANSRERYHTPGDAPYAWVNALQHLSRKGYLIRVADENAYHVRWAPAAEWLALTPAARKRALADGARFDCTAEADTPLADASPIDTGFISHAQDMRSLVLFAKSLLLAGEQDESRRRILRGRPVTLAQIAHAAERHPHLVPMTRIPLGIYLSDAARLRSGQRNSAITCVGIVRNRAFYDTHASDAGSAYVAYQLALRDAALSHPRRSCRELRSATELHASRVVPLTDAVLDARAAILLETIQERYATLSLALDAAPLLEEERLAGAHAAQALLQLEQEVQTIRDCPALTISARGRGDLLDVQEAFWSLDSLYAIRPGEHSRIIVNRFPLVPVLREPPAIRCNSGIGRPVELYFDRVRFVSYAIARWGSSRAAHFIAQGAHALGDLRDPEPFIQALQPESPLSAHTAAAAALGVLDDSKSRGALAGYIARAMEGGRSGTHATGTSLPACEAAVYGLAPSPFGGIAKELKTHERRALLRVTQAHADERLQWVAERVLAAWDESWKRDRLLYL